jgi:hypothetical protein
MLPDALVRLSRKLRMSPLADEHGVAAWHDEVGKDAAKLPADLADRFRELMQELRATIPDDFSFWVGFEFDGVTITIEYEDGNTGSFGDPQHFRSHKSMVRALRSVDWDRMRTDALSNGDIFEELVSEADDRPVNIPSSEEAAKRWASELAPYVTGVRALQPIPAFSLICGRADVGIAVEHFNDRDAVVFTIADRMTTRCDILAMLERGMSWSFPEIESAKLEAVEQLGPISRAKAEGRFFA